jgi:hypothetical protein
MMLLAMSIGMTAAQPATPAKPPEEKKNTKARERRAGQEGDGEMWSRLVPDTNGSRGEYPNHHVPATRYAPSWGMVV